MCGSSAGYLWVESRELPGAPLGRYAGTLGSGVAAVSCGRLQRWSRIAARMPLCSDDFTLLCVLMFSARENLRGCGARTSSRRLELRRVWSWCAGALPKHRSSCSQWSCLRVWGVLSD